MGNNPLRFTDPSGYSFLGCFWNNSLFRSVVAIAEAVALQQPEFATWAGISETTAIVVSGAVAGAIQSGTFQGTLIGAATAAAFSGVGDIKAGLAKDLGVSTASVSVTLHGVVGGLSSVASGGSFQSGFLSAGFADLSGNFGPMANHELSLAATTQAAVSGGIGSVLGGGKFENGAVTGAFGYLYNDLIHALKDRRVFAGADGTVTAAGFGTHENHHSGYGGYVEQTVDSDEGGGKLLYGHLDSSRTVVAPGEQVTRGQLIGEYDPGISGRSTGSHVHLGYTNAKGEVENPTRFAPFVIRGGQVSSSFGLRPNQFGSGWENHLGLDLTANQRFNFSDGLWTLPQLRNY